VSRDCESIFLEGGCGNLSNIASPLQGEAYPTLFCFKESSRSGNVKNILEIDATELKMVLTTTAMDLSVDGNLFKQIRECMSFYFDQCLVRYCPRSCNKVADCLTKYEASMVSSGSSLFMSHVPAFVSNRSPVIYLELQSNGNKFSVLKKKVPTRSASM
jgi:hypothetical protein